MLYPIELRGQDGIGGNDTTSGASPDSTKLQPESIITCRDAKRDAKSGRPGSAQQLIDRGVAPDVAEFLINCVRAERVEQVITRFDQYKVRPADPTAWFQEWLLHWTREKQLSRMGRKTRKIPKPPAKVRKQLAAKQRKYKSKKNRKTYSLIT